MSSSYIMKYSCETMEQFFDYINVQMKTNSEPIGIKISNSSSPTVTTVDRNGEPYTPYPDFFNNHEIWGNIGRCTLTPDGTVTLGTNQRGDGLTLDGTTGNVMVKYPNVQYKYELDGTDIYLWVATYNSNHPYYKYHPNCYTGGALKDHFFAGAYESSGKLDTTFKLVSASGKQPVTGAVSYTDLPESGRFTLDDAITYANNIGTGWSIDNIWSLSHAKLLFLIEYSTRNSQAALGKGVVTFLPGSGFAGVNTGACSIDSQITQWGTGVGLGVDGEKTITWRGRENIWGNTFESIAGLNMNSDGTYHILNRDGTGIISGVLASGSYETGINNVPLLDGYISGIQTDELGALAFIPSSVSGGTYTTYYCDYFYHPAINNTTCAHGNYWNGGNAAGIFSMACNSSLANSSSRSVGARLLYYPQT